MVHYQSYKRTWLTRKIDSHFEKSVFRSADRLVAAANDYATCIKTHVDRKIEVIYNGYDPSDFPKPKSRNTEDFLITYTGELSEDRIPHALLRALDKKETKQVLMDRGLKVTPMLPSPRSFDELRELLTGCGRGCFLKPRYGSGAGGIMAVRYQPNRNKWVVYTTLQLSLIHI